MTWAPWRNPCLDIKLMPWQEPMTWHSCHDVKPVTWNSCHETHAMTWNPCPPSFRIKKKCGIILSTIFHYIYIYTYYNIHIRIIIYVYILLYIHIYYIICIVYKEHIRSWGGIIMKIEELTSNCDQLWVTQWFVTWCEHIVKRHCIKV